MAAPGVIPALGVAVGMLLGGLALGCPRSDSKPTTGAPEAAAAFGPRIVSLSPLATRFLNQLGLDDRIVPVGDARTSEAGAPNRDLSDLSGLARLEPDYVFLPGLPDDQTELAPLVASGVRIVEFAPHDLEDLLALLQGVGVELAGKQGVEAFERRVLRPVAMVAGQSSPTNRLRVIALIDVDPPAIAGGHSFETDLIEIAGASSLTHGGDDARRPIDRDGLAGLKPDLVLVMTEAPLTPEQRESVLDLTYGIAPFQTFEFARETFWLDEPVREATRLRELILAAERERASSGQP